MKIESTTLTRIRRTDLDKIKRLARKRNLSYAGMITVLLEKYQQTIDNIPPNPSK